MKSNSSLIYNLGLVVGDFLALIAAFIGGYAIRAHSNVPVAHPIPAHTYIAVFLAVLPFWIIIFALLGLYNSDIFEKRFSELPRLFVGSFIGLTFVIFWNFVSVTPIFPSKLVPLYGFALAFIFLVLFRNVVRLIRGQLFGYNRGLSRVLIVGNTDMSREIIDWLVDSRHSGYKIVGVVGGKRAVQGHTKLPVYAYFSQFLEEHPNPNLHTIIQTELYADEPRNAELLTYAQEHHATYRFVPGNTELFVGNVNVELFRGSTPVIVVRQTALFGWGRIVKRIFDIVVGSLLVALFSPIFLVIAIAVKLEDGGPVFFRQVRLTRFNREFRVFKFRTNNVTYSGLNPDEAFTKMNRPDLLAKFRANGNFLPNDPRDTRIGRFLRRSSLDELPQLFNVVRGDVSLVGPRALIPSDLAEFKRRHTILSVKSGITGLAQVSGRNQIPVEERRKLDLYYVQNWSFWLDIVILVKTFKSIFAHENEGK
jgi:exopolysaccharide biosynthesis polyprenyl glycosylphosphotransferase